MKGIFDSFYDTFKEYSKTKNYNSITRKALKLCEECGEVAEAVFAFKGNKKKIKKIEAEGQTPVDRITEEVGDVIVVALGVAKIAGVEPFKVIEYATEKLKRKVEDVRRVSV